MTSDSTYPQPSHGPLMFVVSVVLCHLATTLFHICIVAFDDVPITNVKNAVLNGRFVQQQNIAKVPSLKPSQRLLLSGVGSSNLPWLLLSFPTATLKSQNFYPWLNHPTTLITHQAARSMTNMAKHSSKPRRPLPSSKSTSSSATKPKSAIHKPKYPPSTRAHRARAELLTTHIDSLLSQATHELFPAIDLVQQKKDKEAKSKENPLADVAELHKMEVDRQRGERGLEDELVGIFEAVGKGLGGEGK
ncbi:hypothetical protein EV426DRAFT_719615 [Tirmania nivea]|nr:hypothetical protein EV426DRAFT_719615 [Tirmania nivea]